MCIVRAAKSAKRVYRVDADRPVSTAGVTLKILGRIEVINSKQTWPVCHVIDNTNLYIELLRKILAGENPDHGKNGYYLASSGSVAWDDLYAAMAKSLARRGVITDESVALADDEALEKMGTGLGAPKDYVPWQLGGK